MDRALDRNFNRWLVGYARKWKEPLLKEVARLARQKEIENRFVYYPRVRETLEASRFSISDFAKEARKCWVLRNTYDGIRFERFVRKNKSVSALKDLVRDFPNSDSAAEERINDFVNKAVGLGISNDRGRPDFAGAAQLASLILTAKYPKRFVDFRWNRWRNLATVLDYRVPPNEAGYGKRLLWAGKFAVAIAETPTFKKLWPQDFDGYREPLWVISGICWKGPENEKPTEEEWDTNSISFPEGSRKYALHSRLERSARASRIAKEGLYFHDNLLRCQVCNFSFLETYGELGRRVIDAHHKLPLGVLKRETRTKPSDLALVCSNCHRMLHRGKRHPLTLDALRGMFLMKSRRDS